MSDGLKGDKTRARPAERCRPRDARRHGPPRPRGARPAPGAAPRDSAAQRLGTLLHELTHAFLTEWACDKCGTASSNLSSAFNGAHGRAWCRIATALDRVGPRVLGCAALDLGVLAEIVRPVAFKRGLDAKVRDKLLDEYGESAHPSAHDLQGYGFVDKAGSEVEEMKTPGIMTKENEYKTRPGF